MYSYFSQRVLIYHSIICGEVLNTNILSVDTDYIRNQKYTYEGWNFNSGNYLFTTDTK